MHRFFSTSAMALILAAAPAVAQTTTPTNPGTMNGQGAMNQETMNPNAMGQSTPGQGTLNQGTVNQGIMGESGVNQGMVNQGTVNQGSVNQGGVGTVPQSTMDNSAPAPSEQMGASQGNMGTTGQNRMSRDSANGTMTSEQARADNTANSSSNDGPTSPDGTPAFGIEPYFGIMGGYHNYDRLTQSPGVQAPRFDGAMIEGLIGVNIPLGPLFVGVEGHGAYGFGDSRWEYGVRGRGGVRAGDSGLIYLSAGYMWTDVRNGRGFADRESWMWGIGLEAGPRDIGLGGITSNSGLRFRISMETADFDSIRPMAGVVIHF